MFRSDFFFNFLLFSSFVAFSVVGSLGSCEYYIFFVFLACLFFTYRFGFSFVYASFIRWFNDRFSWFLSFYFGLFFFKFLGSLLSIFFYIWLVSFRQFFFYFSNLVSFLSCFLANFFKFESKFDFFLRTFSFRLIFSELAFFNFFYSDFLNFFRIFGSFEFMKSLSFLKVNCFSSPKNFFFLS